MLRMQTHLYTPGKDKVPPILGNELLSKQLTHQLASPHFGCSLVEVYEKYDGPRSETADAKHSKAEIRLRYRAEPGDANAEGGAVWLVLNGRTDNMRIIVASPRVTNMSLSGLMHTKGQQLCQTIRVRGFSRLTREKLEELFYDAEYIRKSFRDIEESRAHIAWRAKLAEDRFNRK